MTDVIPGIYENDIVEVEAKIKVVAPYVNSIQLDISDGSFVSKISVCDPELLKKVTLNYPDIIFEAHLMVSKPEKYIRPYADIGFKRLIAHLESDDPRLFIDEARYENIEIGLAIDAPTDIETIEPFLDELDFVLVMTATAGASGQQLLPETIEKIRRIHESYPNLPIEVDCGINDKTSKAVKDAGAVRLVVTSFIFAKPQDIEKSISLILSS